MIQRTALEWAVHNFASGCEVADMLVERLDFGAAVRESLRFTFERWNGQGFPVHARGVEGCLTKSESSSSQERLSRGATSRTRSRPTSDGLLRAFATSEASLRSAVDRIPVIAP